MTKTEIRTWIYWRVFYRARRFIPIPPIAWWFKEKKILVGGMGNMYKALFPFRPVQRDYSLAVREMVDEVQKIRREGSKHFNFSKPYQPWEESELRQLRKQNDDLQMKINALRMELKKKDNAPKVA